MRSVIPKLRLLSNFLEKREIQYTKLELFSINIQCFWNQSDSAFVWFNKDFIIEFKLKPGSDYLIDIKDNRKEPVKATFLLRRLEFEKWLKNRGVENIFIMIDHLMIALI